MNAEERLNTACQSRDDLTKAQFRKLWLEAHDEAPSRITLARILALFAILTLAFIAFTH